MEKVWASVSSEGCVVSAVRSWLVLASACATLCVVLGDARATWQLRTSQLMSVKPEQNTMVKHTYPEGKSGCHYVPNFMV